MSSQVVCKLRRAALSAVRTLASQAALQTFLPRWRDSKYVVNAISRRSATCVLILQHRAQAVRCRVRTTFPVLRSGNVEGSRSVRAAACVKVRNLSNLYDLFERRQQSGPSDFRNSSLLAKRKAAFAECGLISTTPPTFRIPTPAPDRRRPHVRLPYHFSKYPHKSLVYISSSQPGRVFEKAALQPNPLRYKERRGRDRGRRWGLAASHLQNALKVT